MSARRVVVVGGGLAGITAALHCADAGARVTLLESRPRLGGATWSFQRNGLWADNGQHVFLRCCSAYRGLLHRLGTDELTTLQSRLDIPVLRPGRRPARLRRSRLPAPLHLLPALARYRALSPADRIGMVRAALALQRLDPDDASLDTMSFGSFLRRHRQSAAAVDALWNLITLPALNLPAEEASLALAVKVFRTGLLDDAGAGDVGWPVVPLGRLHGEAAARALERAGVEVHLRTQAAAVELSPLEVVAAGSQPSSARSSMSQPSSARSSMSQPSSARSSMSRWPADAVIVSVPHDAAARLLPASAVGGRPLADLGTSPIVDVHVVYDRPVTALPMAAALGSFVQWVFDRTASSGLEDGQYLAVSVSGAAEHLGRRPEALIQEATGALAELFPAASGARVVDAFVTKEPAATFRQAPGTRALRPGPVSALANVYLAGAWTDTGWPATMEGAVRSGQTAAACALASAQGTVPVEPPKVKGAEPVRSDGGLAHPIPPTSVIDPVTLEVRQ
ncbi:MAG: FAD-dependent oxidoreductase [Acidimicrobiales bacterium]|nr:FAD-dependent oxidoreductase [Acidimicrobiales bacterium]